MCCVDTTEEKKKNSNNVSRKQHVLSKQNIHLETKVLFFYISCIVKQNGRKTKFFLR